MTKCEVCNFNHPDGCGVDFITGEVIDLDKIREGKSDDYYVFLQKEGDCLPTLYLIQMDSEGWQMEWNEVCTCKYCPRCGRDLTKGKPDEK